MWDKREYKIKAKNLINNLDSTTDWEWARKPGTAEVRVYAEHGINPYFGCTRQTVFYVAALEFVLPEFEQFLRLLYYFW